MKYHKQQKLSNFIQLKPVTPQHFPLSAKKDEHMSQKKMASEKKEMSQAVSSSISHQLEANRKYNKYSMMTNFKSWLGEQKRIWK